MLVGWFSTQLEKYIKPPGKDRFSDPFTPIISLGEFFVAGLLFFFKKSPFQSGVAPFLRLQTGSKADSRDFWLRGLDVAE